MEKGVLFDGNCQMENSANAAQRGVSPLSLASTTS
jgi:hypothetical protein